MPGLAALRRFVGGLDVDARERCELCGSALADAHPHVVELAAAAVRCACPACAILFRDAGAGGGRFRTVPERVLVDGKFAIGEPEWQALGLPVRLAFVVRRAAWFGYFPSPAGPTEAPLPGEPWEALARASRLVGALERDVEALLIRRRPGAAADCLLAPIDAGFALAALVRKTWRGIAGGDEAWRAVDDFFAALAARARRLDGGTR